MAKTNGSEATKSRTHGSTTAVREITTSNQPDNPLIQALQTQVANGILLYLNYKHYHWQTFGPLFRDLHLLFDEFSAAVIATVDEFAERIRMIGGNPVADPTAMVATATVKVATAKVVGAKGSMRQMVAEADANVLTVIREMRDGASLADDNDDPGTADLFARVVQIHEKHEWFLREILEEGDGLID